MKNKKFLIVILLLILLGSGLLVYYDKFMDNDKGEKTLDKEYTLDLSDKLFIMV